MATHGCGRGVFGLKDWDPQRRAGYPSPAVVGSTPANRSQDPVHQKSFVNKADTRQEPVSNGGFTADIRAPGYRSQPPTQTTGQTQRTSQSSAKERPMMAKYSYKANLDSPLGKELTVKQGEKLTFVDKHENEHWWLGRNAEGEVGLVPSSYMMIQEQKVSQLPWLQNRAIETDAKTEQNNKFGVPEKVEFKPYQSAYNRTTQPENEYRCKVCERSFNGPIPYQAHMSSKAHKEELEAQDLA